MAYVNSHGGSLVSLGQSSLASAYTWLPVALNQTALNFADVTATAEMGYISATSTSSGISHANCG